MVREIQTNLMTTYWVQRNLPQGQHQTDLSRHSLTVVETRQTSSRLKLQSYIILEHNLKIKRLTYDAILIRLIFSFHLPCCRIPISGKTKYTPRLLSKSNKLKGLAVVVPIMADAEEFSSSSEGLALWRVTPAIRKGSSSSLPEPR